ncbi:hypothetical protein EIK56_07050 [Sphingomonas sp. C8-2]|nr:hypothetical protein EIK56_07050 [Sphingomonas sp. C8-2]
MRGDRVGGEFLRHLLDGALILGQFELIGHVRSLSFLPGTGRGTAGGGGGGDVQRRYAPPLHHAIHGPPPRAGEEYQPSPWSG